LPFIEAAKKDAFGFIFKMTLLVAADVLLKCEIIEKYNNKLKSVNTY